MGRAIVAVLLPIVVAGCALPARAADPALPGFPPDALVEPRLPAEPWGPVGTGPSRYGYGGHPASGRPARRVTGGPGYAVSEYGLGKPAYSGVGPRPDWGRSTFD